jgi:hypothetical protein
VLWPLFNSHDQRAIRQVLCHLHPIARRKEQVRATVGLSLPSQVLDLEHSAFATMERHVLARAQQHMRPELYARIGEKLVFCKLDYEVLQIALNFIVSAGDSKGSPCGCAGRPAFSRSEGLSL